MSTFIANVPIWVLPLFLGLLFISLRATRARSVPRAVFYGLPLLGLLALRTVASLDSTWTAITVFGLAYAAGAAFGHRAQIKWIVRTTRSHVSLRGEWLTLITIMGIFALNFVNGAINCMAPQLAATTLYAAAFSAVGGGLSGIFFGRALRVMQTSIPAT